MSPRPPRVPRWLASHLLRGDAREIVVGDLDEAFARRLERGAPPRTARLRYWHEAFSSIAAIGMDRSASRDGEKRSMRPLQGLSLDLRHACRGLAASRGFTAVAVLSLAIGIGATTALVNIARTLLVTELPVERPGELSWLFWSADLRMRITNFGDDGVNREGRNYRSNYSYPLYRAVKTALGSRAELAGYNVLRRLNVVRGGQPASVVAGLIVSGDFFPTLRLPVVLGRPITEADDTDGAAAVAVISDAFWRRTFGGDSGAIGSVLHVNGTPFEVIGVTAPGFDGLSPGGAIPPVQIIVPLSAHAIVAPSWKGATPLRDDFRRQWVRILARVPAGSDRAPLTPIVAGALRQTLAGIVPADADLRTVDARLLPANRGLDSLRRSAEQPLAVLVGVVAIFLLITCTNLAGMLMARGIARRRELAVRKALGAARWRLVRESLVESLLLAAIGGTAGTVLAIWSAPAATVMLSEGLDAADVRLVMDWPFLSMAASITVMTALFFGAIPALRLTRVDSTAELRERAGRGRQRGGRALMVVQLAVTVPLLVGALLFMRTLRNLSAVDLGFDPSGLVLFEINPVRTTRVFDPAVLPATEAQRVRDLLTRLEAIPGVTSATVLENALLTGRTSNTEARIGGQPARFMMEAVGPAFFETMRMPIVAGRAIGAGDVAASTPVAVINEAAARQYFASRSPIGQTFTVVGSGTTPAQTIEIVGVVADARYGSLRSEPAPTFYDSYFQRPGGTYATFFAVRTSVPPASITAAIRAAAVAVDPGLPVTGIETQQHKIDRSIGRERVLSRLLAVFGGFALLLASLGLHGLTAYAVARRTAEIAIRLALGAQRSQVVWLMLRRVLALSIAGLALGLPLAWAAGPLTAAYLFGVPPRDPWTIAVAAVVLTAVSLVAGWLPARRAARMHPLSGLRVE